MHLRVPQHTAFMLAKLKPRGSRCGAAKCEAEQGVDQYGLALQVRRDKNPKMRGIGGTDEVNNESLSELGKENSLRLARCMLTVSQRSHDTL